MTLPLLLTYQNYYFAFLAAGFLEAAFGLAAAFGAFARFSAVVAFVFTDQVFTGGFSIADQRYSGVWDSPSRFLRMKWDIVETIK